VLKKEREREKERKKRKKERKTVNTSFLRCADE
jgi:hypothetical protein